MAQPGKPTPAKSGAAAKPAPSAAQPAPAPAAAAAKPTPAAKPAATATKASVGGSERARMISEAAYFIAQSGSGSGNALADWLTAEKQIDQQLAKRR